MHLTVEQVVERLGHHRNTIYRMRKDGRLVSVKTKTSPKGRVLITEESVQELELQRALESGAKAAG